MGCEVNASWVTEAMPQVIFRYARNMLSKKSDIDGEEEVCRSAEIYIKTVEMIEVQKRLIV